MENIFRKYAQGLERESVGARRVIIAILIVVTTTSPLIALTPSISTHIEIVRPPNVPSQTPHQSIAITGDNSFVTQNWNGSGTLEDPYLITDLLIEGFTQCI